MSITVVIDYDKISERRLRGFRIIRNQYQELYQLFLEMIETAFKTHLDINDIVLIGCSPFNDGDTVSFTLYDPRINDQDRYDYDKEWSQEWETLVNNIENFSEVLEAEHDSGWKLTFERDKSDKGYSVAIEAYYD